MLDQRFMHEVWLVCAEEDGHRKTHDIIQLPDCLLRGSLVWLQSNRVMNVASSTVFFQVNSHVSVSLAMPNHGLQANVQHSRRLYSGFGVSLMFLRNVQ